MDVSETKMGEIPGTQRGSCQHHELKMGRNQFTKLHPFLYFQSSRGSCKQLNEFNLGSLESALPVDNEHRDLDVRRAIGDS